MQPEVPAALARTGLVVVACWVLNAPVLLAIRVLGTCGPCCVVPPDRPGTRSTFLPSPLTRHSLLAQATSPIERARRRRPACPHPSLGSVSSHRSAPSRPVLTRSVLCHVWSCGFHLACALRTHAIAEGTVDTCHAEDRGHMLVPAMLLSYFVFWSNVMMAESSVREHYRGYNAL